MDNIKMQEIQRKLIEFQSSLQEKATSDDGKISAMMNGRMEITDLQIPSDINIHKTVPIIKEVINKLIKQVSVKIQENLKTLSQLQ